ncbi:Decarbamoylnovobiocin carbamoyltransferase [Mycobacterium pseudokansasii]|uniref:Decarbamoylnovobiocin carbamoyltransferase n=1 Tax=Mycobacterium pseudokansasii TaxID=2341080 RepID=A0A498QKR2_9MYCO|nr:hypothetical protein A4G27_17825 [Mycobacterium kansasii]VAZ89547.1 Decarbamoylnovobiocin carbamoyltransferase [Mycobacterium pseudokansasii]VAZ90278.1 Decarbamoylnovobiocin carbamoyltransferase [Mycobacterium pseudokansasii]VBA47611.1 Decarbamoylnovobiocin carbamoyltransferase [Mycobacterium pseudokansasii]
MLDGIGEDGTGGYASGLVADGRRDGPAIRRTFTLEQSLGLFYQRMIGVVGFGVFDEYKVMALAADGDAGLYGDLFASMFELLPDGDYRFATPAAQFDRLAGAGLIGRAQLPATHTHLGHMNVVVEVRPDRRAALAGQTVARADNPRLWELLEALGERTGVPVLINTSFNRAGEPLVDSLDDAVDAFLGMGLDRMVLGERLVAHVGSLDTTLPSLTLGLAPYKKVVRRALSFRMAGFGTPSKAPRPAFSTTSACVSHRLRSNCWCAATAARPSANSVSDGVATSANGQTLSPNCSTSGVGGRSCSGRRMRITEYPALVRIVAPPGLSHPVGGPDRRGG